MLKPDNQYVWKQKMTADLPKTSFRSGLIKLKIRKNSYVTKTIQYLYLWFYNKHSSIIYASWHKFADTHCCIVLVFKIVVAVIKNTDTKVNFCFSVTTSCFLLNTFLSGTCKNPAFSCRSYLTSICNVWFLPFACFENNHLQ